MEERDKNNQYLSRRMAQGIREGQKINHLVLEPVHVTAWLCLLLNAPAGALLRLCGRRAC